MTPGRAKVYTWLFLGLAGCATVNVMLFQQRLPMRGMGGVYGDSSAGGAAGRVHLPVAPPSPAATSSSNSSASGAAPRGTKVALAQEPVPRSPAVVQAELTQAIQRELNSTGLFTGLADGKPSKSLTAAIAAYEFQQGMPVSGEATDILLKRLILGAMPAIKSKHVPGEIIPGSPADHLVRWVIESLNKLGHDAGKPQSKLDLKAMQAIRAFEAGELMRPTGRIGEAFVRQLEQRLR